MPSFVQWVDLAIYGTGGERIVTPNVWEWTQSYPIVSDDETDVLNFPYGAGNPTPADTFVSYLVDTLLPLCEAWLSGQNLPPLVEWDGRDARPWEGTATGALVAGLDGTFTGIADEAALGAALWQQYVDTSIFAPELGDVAPQGATGLGPLPGRYARYLETAPYSHRFWSFLKWAQGVVRRFRGELVVPPVELIDHDGVVLSTKPFLDAMNPAHRFWHLGATNAADVTPGQRSAFGQLRRNFMTDPFGTGLILYSHVDFLRFHGDVVNFLKLWHERRGETPTPGYNSTDGRPRSPDRVMLVGSTVASGDHDWTADSGGVPRSPGAWQESSTSWHPWPNAPGDVGPWPPAGTMVTNIGGIQLGGASPTGFSTNLGTVPVVYERVGNVSVLGWMLNFPMHAAPWPGRVHPWGHWRGPDFMNHDANNYSDRFRQYHGWMDNVWRWREPRLSWWDPATHLWTRHFAPVHAGGPLADTDWPGYADAQVAAVVIVRDPAGGPDTLWPDTAVSGWNATTGAGTVRVRMRVSDSWGRDIQVSLSAAVYASGADPDHGGIPVATSGADVFVVGGGGGAVGALDTDVFRGVTLASGLGSDDPGGAAPNRVGFVNRLVRVTAVLSVADGSDPGWVRTETLDIELVREAEGPAVVQVLASPATFVRSRVAADIATGGGSVTYAGAFTVVLQDRTTDAFVPTWPIDTIDELKPLLRRRVPCSGLFDTAAGMPAITLTSGPTGVTITPVGAPAPEDPSLPPSVLQRYTCSYDVTFTSTADFDTSAPGATAPLPVAIDAWDRSQNHTAEAATLTLVEDADPRMDDGSPSWLSADTRVFKVFASEARFGSTPGADPVAYIQAVLAGLNAGTTGADTFEALPTAQSASALEYEREAVNPATSATEAVYNFVLAKVRVADTGAAAADRVRVFFRLFSYTSSNLTYDTAAGYRTYVDPTPDGAGHVRVVPLLGFDGEAEGADCIAVPFFATARVGVDVAATDQPEDAPNVKSFPADARVDGSDLVVYFGAWLDINQDEARFPLVYTAAGPDGPFEPGGGLVPFRSLVLDAHQCLVAEIRYDGDPTPAGATPSGHDNLAQRNLVILNPDNPGAEITRVVEHAFLADMRGRRRDARAVERHRAQVAELRAAAERALARVSPAHTDDELHDDPKEMGAHAAGEMGAHAAMEMGATTDRSVGFARAEGAVLGRYNDAIRVPDAVLPPLAELGGVVPLGRPAWINGYRRDRLVRDAALASAMAMTGSMHDAVVEPFVQLAHVDVDARHPFVFDGRRWLDTSRVVDELRFDWNDLPRGSEVELFLPGINAEDVINYRNLRHAPRDVRIIDSHRLKLLVGGPTYVPLPGARDGRVAGVLRVTLPEGIRAGERYSIDVVQIRGGREVVGAFAVVVEVGKAAALWEGETRLLARLHRQLSHRGPRHLWHAVLQQRVGHTRRRARALAEAAGVSWRDPTTWGDPDRPVAPGEPPAGGPLVGREVRVILERIEVVDDRDPWFKGRGEVAFTCRVVSDDNGGQRRDTRLPVVGFHKVGDRPPHNVLHIDAEVFRGWVDRSLRLAISGTERDTFDPDDPLGRYTRTFCGGVADWLGAYGPTGAGPGSDGIDAEDVGAWRLWYRVELA